MNLQAEIKWIQKELQMVKDPTFIEAIKNMLLYRKKVSEGRVSIEQYNKEIDEAIQRVEQGEFYTQKEVDKKIIDKWLE